MALVISFIFSISILLLALGYSAYLSKRRYKRNMILNPVNVLFSGVVLSSISMFMPMYIRLFQTEHFSWVKAILLSIHNTLRLFILDGDFNIITDYVGKNINLFESLFTTLSAFLFVLAPLLTFGAVMLFFKNMAAYKRYIQSYWSDTYIFSALNEQSLALASDFKHNDKNRLIVFTQVFEKNEEEPYELVERARELGAILFKKDMETVKFDFHHKKNKLVFFSIDEDDAENIKHSVNIINKYNQRENTELYIFSTSVNSALLMHTVDKGKIKVRRVNSVQSLISRYLYDEGKKIFDSAIETAEGYRQISAVVIGMGQHGTTMTKALSWLCQMDGYRAEINVFDKDPLAESKFRALCPELLDEKFNTGKFTEGDACYKIRIHGGLDVSTQEFIDAIKSVNNATYAFVCLGDDELNIETSVALRTLFERQELHPVIDAVIYDSKKMKTLKGITNYSGQSYDINFTGDLETSYSEDVILRSDVEEDAFGRHKRYCAYIDDEQKRKDAEEDFWRFEYNYRSSVASAIHRKMKIECNIPGIEKPISERTEEEIWNIRKLEHRRWNAYMRSEGYVYGEKRNNLAKTHHCITDFKKLSEIDKQKDDD